MQRLHLSSTGRMGRIQELVLCLIRLLLDSGEPLECKRRPFKLLNGKSIIEIATVFDPDLVSLLGSHFLFGLFHHSSHFLFDYFISGNI